MVSLFAISNFFGRLFSGIIADREWANSLVIVNLGLFISGLVHIALPFCGSFWEFAVCGMITGFSAAPLFAVTTLTLVEHFGMDNLTVMVGMEASFFGAGTSIGTIICGILFDYYHSYTIPFICGGIFFISSSVIGEIVHVKTSGCTRNNAAK